MKFHRAKNFCELAPSGSVNTCVCVYRCVCVFPERDTSKTQMLTAADSRRRLNYGNNG